MVRIRIFLRFAFAAALTLRVFGQVPKPQNVKIHSVNFKHVLQWDPVVCRKGNISYSVGYQSSYSHFYEKDEPFEKSCTNINTTQCDLSNALADEISYWLHVRAKCKSRTSKWAAVEDFQPFRDTLIGPPPNFNVKVKLDMLDVLFAEPMKENSQRTMRSYYTSMAFKISYWKNTDPKKILNVVAEAPMKRLNNLEPRTEYCLQVSCIDKETNITGLPSRIVCATTMDDDKIPLWMTMVVLLISLAVVFIMVMGVFSTVICSYRTIRYAFYPSYSLPEHIKEMSLSSLLMLPDSQNSEEEFFDKLSIVSDFKKESSKKNDDMSANPEQLWKYPSEENKLMPEDKQEPCANTNNPYGNLQTLMNSAA
ncbi:interleukin-10 receptor subunit beta-like isoform X2 [Callorhinchus milii]|uniref:interleukin-10 receptor subunit beta-like isoform X2 n=1 Tax=Callorhinchus milii TaxID=7868 RepID=UPI001C3F5963|nr:interleukin-10 receptor subunit beta-like isoform X2 [Callorhinchus milii]